MVGSPGWKLLADSDRQDPSEAQKRAYVIADNKLALNAGWDDALLKIELTELQALDFDLGMVAFAQGDLHPNSMALSLPDTKLLWGRAAARCSRDGCGRDLTRCNQGQHYILGEQAHVTGQSPAGPRPIQQGGPDTYENMILLCPTCHTEIDKKPDLFPRGCYGLAAS